MDHAVPAPTITDAAGGARAAQFAAELRHRAVLRRRRHGICHQVIAENGLARPGEVLTCTDSHTCAAGAYNNAARGLGPAEVYSIMCTGQTWFQVAPTMRYELDGRQARRGQRQGHFPAHRRRLRRRRNQQPGVWRARAWPALPMNDRRTIATQGAEISADFSTFDVDEVLPGLPRRARRRPVTSRGRPGPGRRLPGGPRMSTCRPLEPYVARPGTVSRNAAPGLRRSSSRRSTSASSARAPTASSRICGSRPRILRGSRSRPGCG